MWTDPERWQPVDVDELEPAADQTVRSRRSTLVTAGPGAGKTELLAQRGCFLLQTGACPPPRKILAVSFKVDAAANLRRRVERRCEAEARRFHSVTLDAFAKGIVDRFRLGLPPNLRPVSEFSPRLIPPRDAELGDFLQSLTPPHALGNSASLRAIRRQTFYERQVIGMPLAWPAVGPNSLAEWAAGEFWRQAIGASGVESGALTFPMISRLADLVLRVNPMILFALRAAYPYVFLDEFQDTTKWHYDLLRTAFLGSGSCLTAVGDTKQRIMLWAGAHAGISAEFVQEFGAQRKELVRNYRSAPELVRIQNELARLLEDDAAECVPAGHHDAAGVCQVLETDDTDVESEWIADQVEAGVAAGLSPSEFCLIYRQRVGTLSTPAVEALRGRGIRARDETAYQDILDETAVRLIVASMRLGLSDRDPDAWEELTNLIRGVHGLGDDDHRVTRMALAASAEAFRWLERDPESEEDVCHAGNAIIDAVGRTTVREAVPAYSRTDWLDTVVSRASTLLAADRANAPDWTETLSRFEGIDTVKAMTIHKSKGLEYDTVIFVGLEDSSWWAFARQEEEERRVFFVAFSRAIRRVVFTYTAQRDTGRGLERQRRSGIQSLYDALYAAGAERITATSTAQKTGNV